MANLYKRHQLMGMRPITPQPRPFERDLVDSLVQNGLVDIVRRRRLPCLTQPVNGERLIKDDSQWFHEHESQNRFTSGTEPTTNGAKNDVDKRFSTYGTKNGTYHRTSQHEASAESEEPIRQQLDGQDLEWKFKNRPVPDASPVPAPVDTGSQTNEGFKRFYKAVVSPTHVRVTAGGRIVPNPRGSSSPTGKVSNDKLNGDPLSFTLARPVGQVPANDVVSTGGSVQAKQGSMPTGFPGMMPPSLSMGGLPMVPFPFGYPMPHMPLAPAGMLPTQEPNRKGDKTDKGSTKSEQPAHSPIPVPNPNPFFAASAQPFMPGMPLPMPMSMMASHAGMPAFSAGAVPPMAPQMPFAPVFGPMQWQSGQFPQHMPMHMQVPMPIPMPMALAGMPGMPFPGASPVVNGQPLHAPSVPSPSSIVMSDVTRKHIENFRAQLKWIDNQLQYNKHQVDENYMKHLADGVRTQLKTFERNLKSQLEHEAKQRGKGSSKDSSKTREASKSTSVVSETGDEIAHKNTSLGREENRAKVAGYNQKSALSVVSTDNSDKAEIPVAIESLASIAPSASNGPLKKRSGLPITAALAPPFQPRSQKNVLPNQELSRELSKQPKELDRSVMMECSQIIKAPLSLDPMHVADSGAAGPSNQLKPRITSYSQLNTLNNGLGLPYLEGKLRPGVNMPDAKDEDYIYHRQLNDDEVRARHLYWGNAPRSVQRGLPKYDGKNFYPPSPSKEKKFMDFATPYKPQISVDGLIPNQNYLADAEHKMSQLSTGDLDDYGYLTTANQNMARLPVGDLSDYGLKTKAEQRKTSRAINGKGDYGFAPTDPNDNVRTMKELLALSLTRHEQKNKRDTKSDNVNGNNLTAKDKAGTRGRPATSILSQEYSDSDQTQGSNIVARSFRSPLHSTQSQSAQSDDAEDSREKILFRGRQSMTRASKHNGAMTLVQKSAGGA
ncbi:hypothetical protein ACHAQH_001916, partial [Verticillium albo-atrum]